MKSSSKQKQRNRMIRPGVLIRNVLAGFILLAALYAYSQLEVREKWFDGSDRSPELTMNKPGIERLLPIFITPSAAIGK